MTVAHKSKQVYTFPMDKQPKHPIEVFCFEYSISKSEFARRLGISRGALYKGLRVGGHLSLRNTVKASELTVGVVTLEEMAAWAKGD